MRTETRTGCDSACSNVKEAYRAITFEGPVQVLEGEAKDSGSVARLPFKCKRYTDPKREVQVARPEATRRVV